MLNLTELLSQRPAPVKGARFVRGYAMSGCKDDGHTPPALLGPSTPTRPYRTKEEATKLRVENREATLALRRSVTYLPLLNDWVDARTLGRLVGVSADCVSSALRRMEKDGLVQRKAVPKAGGPGKGKFLWKKI